MSCFPCFSDKEAQKGSVYIEIKRKGQEVKVDQDFIKANSGRIQQIFQLASNTQQFFWQCIPLLMTAESFLLNISLNDSSSEFDVILTSVVGIIFAACIHQAFITNKNTEDFYNEVLAALDRKVNNCEDAWKYDGDSRTKVEGLYGSDFLKARREFLDRRTLLGSFGVEEYRNQYRNYFINEFLLIRVTDKFRWIFMCMYATHLIVIGKVRCGPQCSRKSWPEINIVVTILFGLMGLFVLVAITLRCCTAKVDNNGVGEPDDRMGSLAVTPQAKIDGSTESVVDPTSEKTINGVGGPDDIIMGLTGSLAVTPQTKIDDSTKSDVDSKSE